MKAICMHSVIPMRSQANHSGEMISQILFGELMEIVDRKGKQWYKVRCETDNNFGWVAARQIQMITNEEFNVFKIDFSFALDLLNSVRAKKRHFPIPIGSRLPGFDGMRFRLYGEEFHYSGQAVHSDALKKNPHRLLPKIAQKFLNAPEMKGGRSPLGIDSPGLVQMVFSFLNFQIPRYPDLQVETGETVDFVEQIQPGDIAFFENQKGRIHHCGIALPDQKIIHASGIVKIDKIDHFGIYDEAISKYTHKLRIIKRLLPKPENPIKTKAKNSEKSNNPQALFDL